jgi:hypothetical protein
MWARFATHLIHKAGNRAALADLATIAQRAR